MISEISDKASKNMTTATLDEAADLLRQIAGGRQADESIKAVFRRLGKKLTDWSDSRIRGVWYRDSRVRLRAEEVDQLRALSQLRDRRKQDNELEELRATVKRLAKYEALLERIDARFAGEEVHAPRDQAGQASGVLGNGGARLRS